MEPGLPISPGNEFDAAETPQSVTDEELFETYLTARLEQAVNTLNQARDALAAEPQDFNRVIQVMRRVHELRDVRAQLDAQRERVATARHAAGIEAAANEASAGEQAVPGSAFRAAQSEQADKVMATLALQPRTCPACQALLAPTSTQCHCGHSEDTEPDATGRDPQTQDPSRFNA